MNKLYASIILQCVLLGQNRGVSYSAKRCDDNTEIFHYCRWALLRSASKFLCSLCDGISHCCKYIFHTKYLCWNISDLSICPFIHIYSIKNNFIVILIVLFLSECDFWTQLLSKMKKKSCRVIDLSSQVSTWEMCENLE